MPLSEDLIAAYALSARPYIEADGPIPAGVIHLRSWRYLIELNTACNLRCVMCTVGNQEGYERTPGNKLMDMDLLNRVLDKMQAENPNAIVCPYGNSEPFLHPHLADCIRAIKARGFKCEVATNLQIVNNIDDILAAKPDFLIVSVSGFSQETYSKSHRGGDIEKVKANLKTLAEANKAHNIFVGVSYHMYNDNLGEVEMMRDFVKETGFLFMLSWARTISLENTIQCLRFIDQQKGIQPADYPIKNGLDLNKLFPTAKYEYLQNMERLRFHPGRAVNLYARFPVAPVCLVGDIFTYIRHDGQVQLCAWTEDTRLTLGNYMDMTQEQISEARRGFPLCQECLKYRMNLYYHVADCTKWDGGGYP